MNSEGEHPAVLNYSADLPAHEIAFLPQMRRWRLLAAWSFVGSFAAVIFVSPITFLFAAALFLLGTVMTLIYMTQAAASEVGRGYAIRHLLLAIALLPCLFMGLFIVPLIVESEMQSWRTKQN